MIADERQFLHTLLRTNFSAFTHRVFQTVVPRKPFFSNWHIEAIAYDAARVMLTTVLHPDAWLRAGIRHHLLNLETYYPTCVTDSGLVTQHRKTGSLSVYLRSPFSLDISI